MIDSIGLARETAPRAIHPLAWVMNIKRAARSTLCVLMGGHWRLLHATRDRMCLRCVACGDSTAGWDVGPRHRER